MFARPTIIVDAPAVARAGDELEIVVRVGVARACRARALEVTLVGQLLSSSRTYHLRFEQRRVAIDGERLAAGDHLFRFRLPVPENLPMPLRAPDRHVGYEVEARLDLPLRADVRHAVPVEVAEGRAILPEGLTCGLQTRLLVRVPPDAADEPVRVELVGKLVGPAYISESMQLVIGRARPAPGRAETPVDVLVPADTLPSLVSSGVQVEWQLEVHAGGRRLESGAAFVHAARRSPARFVAPPPAPASLEAWWLAAAARAGLVAVEPAGRFAGSWHGVSVEAWIADDAFHALLTYASFELDLDPGAGSRHPEQGEAVLAVLAPVLWPFTVLHLDDRRAHVRQDPARRERVRDFLGALEHLAARLGDGRPPLPPPPPMAAAFAAWTRLAAALDGTLSPARMRITGRHGAAHVEIATLWQGATPFRTRLVLTPARALELSPVRLSWIETGRPPVDALGRVLPPERRSLLERVVVGAYALEVERERVVLDLPAPLHDDALLHERVVQMAELVELLGAFRAPFR